MSPLTLLVVLAAVAGCGPTDRSQLADEVLQADPSFQSVLEVRDRYASQIETAEREYALKRDTVQRTIQALRQELAEGQRSVKQKKARYQVLIEPQRKRLDWSLSMATEELRNKRIQRASVGRSISQLRKALTAPDETWAEPDRQRRERQLQEMRRDAQRLDEEMTVLKQHLRLLQLKLRLIRL